MNKAAPSQEATCNPHPDAPHGFARDASHSEGRYVCECEFWEPEAAQSQEYDINKCPGCGGEADNGHDREVPPNPYYCTKCEAAPSQEPVITSEDACEDEYIKWHNARRERILAKQEELRAEMVAEGFSNSAATAAQALYSAIKVVDGVNDRDIWKAAWNAAKAAPSQEPVEAWMLIDDTGMKWVSVLRESSAYDIPLYTTPPDAAAQIACLNAVCDRHVIDNAKLQEQIAKLEAELRDVTMSEAHANRWHSIACSASERADKLEEQIAKLEAAARMALEALHSEFDGYIDTWEKVRRAKDALREVLGEMK